MQSFVTPYFVVTQYLIDIYCHFKALMEGHLRINDKVVKKFPCALSKRLIVAVVYH